MKIVRTKRYARDLKRLKAAASDVDAMERMIAANPAVGAVIQGLRGVRKARFRIGNRGKSGGGRVVYYVVTKFEAVAMLMVYAKSEKSDLSPLDRENVLRMLKEIGS